MKTKPKYNIDSVVWVMDTNKACEKVVYGVFPVSELYRVLPRGNVSDKDMTSEDFEAWKMMPEDNRMLSFEVVDWQYLIAPEVTDAHLICKRLSEYRPQEVLGKLYGLVSEEKMFESKEELLKSL